VQCLGALIVQAGAGIGVERACGSGGLGVVFFGEGQIRGRTSAVTVGGTGVGTLGQEERSGGWVCVSR
jgi:hypothetical protein